MHAFSARLLFPAFILALLASGSQAAPTHPRRALPAHEHQKTYSFLSAAKPTAIIPPQAHPAEFIKQPESEGNAIRTAKNITSEIHVSPAYSWIDTFSPEESTQLATLVAKQIESRLPLSQTVLLIPPPATPSAKVFHASLANELQKRGFTLAAQPTNGVASVRYRISRTGFRVLLRLRIQNTEITRLYEHSVFGHYIAVSPLCVIDRGEE